MYKSFGTVFIPRQDNLKRLKIPKTCPVNFFIFHHFYFSEKKSCISFGDPHYRTFDGKAYSYQGICKYTLAKDCTEAKTFNIITRNDGRYANTFSWIRSVVFKYANLSISLQQNYRVKINGRVVSFIFYFGANFSRHFFIFQGSG